MKQLTPWQRAIKSVKQPWTMATKSAPVLSVDVLDPGNYNRGTIADPGFFLEPTLERFFTFSSTKSIIEAYQKCPPVAAIVNRKAQSFSKGKVYILDKDGNESTSDVANRIRKLMKRPNPMQTWADFDMQTSIYQNLFGFCPVLAIKPAGFKENWRAKSLWNLPPFMVKIEESSALFYQGTMADMIKKITLKYKDEETTLDANDVLILRDLTPSFKTMLIPDSRLRALEMPVNNIIGALESRNVLINYRGALGILSPEKDQFGVAPIDPDAKTELQTDFLRYGLTSQQWKFIITSAALKWQQMGIPTKDLMLLEEVVESTKMICDNYGHPAQMLGIIDPKYDNWKAAERGLYENAIIPESDSNYQQWNEFFDAETNGLTIMKDFSHLAILQADAVQEATARKTLNEAKKIEWESDLITRNQWLAALDEDGIGPDGDKRISEMPKTSGPLAAAIGVGGVQGLISVITAAGIAPEAKQATIEILFGIAPADAARMVQETEKEDPPPNPPPPGPGSGEQEPPEPTTT